ncbi:alpha/beta-hydrolase, partial [Martensiomyces pterosporus]
TPQSEPVAPASKPVLLCLHGFLGSKRQWMSMGPRLADALDHDVYALDLRNHGESPHMFPHRYSDMARDIEAFVGALGIDRVSLMGHSMGGKVAMTLALTNPQLVDKLVVEDNVPCRVRLLHDYSYYIEGMKRIADQRVSSRKEGDAILQEYVHDPGMRRFVLSNLTKKESEGGAYYSWSISLDNLNEGYRFMGGWSIPPSDSGADRVFGKPALFVCSKRSSYWTPARQPEIDRQFPQNEVVLLDAGHNVAWEQPDEFL